MNIEERAVRRKKTITTLLAIDVTVMILSIIINFFLEGSLFFTVVTVCTFSLVFVLVLAYLMFSTEETGSKEQLERDKLLLQSVQNGRLNYSFVSSLGPAYKFIAVMIFLFISGALNLVARFFGYTDDDSYSSFILVVAYVTIFIFIYLLRKSWSKK